MNIQRTENIHTGDKLLMVHRFRNGVENALWANLRTGEVDWRFGYPHLVACCTTPEATEAAFRLMAMETHR
jgi:hypothetical protein